MGSFFIILLNLLTVYAAYPKCPNDGQPKEDEKGNFIQCLPGDSFALSCGDTHYCFYSGVNYLCCPSYEKQVKKLACPEPLITVLNSRGDVLKCNEHNKECSKRGMLCMNVEDDFICCEKRINRDSEPNNKSQCPPNSSVVLTANGRRLPCDADRECIHNDHFCSGETASVCCVADSAIKNNSMRTVKQTEDNMVITENMLNDHQETTQGHEAHTTATVFITQTSTREPENEQSKIRANTAKELIRERIMNGWPYNEIFFHP